MLEQPHMTSEATGYVAGDDWGQAPCAEVPATQKDVCLSTDQFVAKVIYDGRFLRTFTEEPEAVARALGIEVAPDVLIGLRGRDASAVLAEATQTMTRQHAEGMVRMDPDMPPPQAGVVAFIAVGIVCCVIPGHSELTGEIGDESKDADLKM